jgi:hypothetical protein
MIHINPGPDAAKSDPLDNAMRLSILTSLMRMQTEVIQVYGPVNPVVSLEHYRATLAEILRLNGIENPESFVGKPIDTDRLQSTTPIDTWGGALNGGTSGPLLGDPENPPFRGEHVQKFGDVLAEKAAEQKAKSSAAAETNDKWIVEKLRSVVAAAEDRGDLSTMLRALDMLSRMPGDVA